MSAPRPDWTGPRRDEVRQRHQRQTIPPTSPQDIPAPVGGYIFGGETGDPYLFWLSSQLYSQLELAGWCWSALKRNTSNFTALKGPAHTSTERSGRGWYNKNLRRNYPPTPEKLRVAVFARHCGSEVGGLRRNMYTACTTTIFILCRSGILLY